MTSLHFICDAGQPNNNVGGWYDKAYASYKCVETGEVTKIEDLGRISINRAELKAYIHILWSLCRKYKDTSNIKVFIKGDSMIAIKATKRLKELKTKDKSLREAAFHERQVYHEYASKFASVEAEWVSRDYIVKVLGH